jgi:hypothetical protein
MASSTASSTGSVASANGRARTRRPKDPVRRRLAFAVVMVLIGSFLPWIYTALGSVSGARGAGLWTFYAATLGLAAALVPLRKLAAAQAALFAAVAVGLPLWQVLHLLRLVGAEGWFPGPGLVMVFGGGVLAGTAAWRLLREPAPTG